MESSHTSSSRSGASQASFHGWLAAFIEHLKRAHSRFPGHALTPTGVMAIRCKQFHLPDL